MFLDEAHEHVMLCPVIAFRLAVGVEMLCRWYKPEELAYALKELGCELLTIICQN